LSPQGRKSWQEQAFATSCVRLPILLTCGSRLRAVGRKVNRSYGPDPNARATFCLDGPGQVLHGILRHLDPSRFRAAVVGILSKRDAGMWRDGKSVFRRMGVEVIDLALPKPWDLFCLPRLLRVMRDLRPDVIHTQLIRADLYGRAADALYRAPRLISTMHYVEDWARSRHPACGCLLAADCLTQRLVDCLVSVSHSVQKEVLRFYGRHAPRYEVIQNGIEPIDQPRAAPGALAQQMGWSRNTVTVLFAGRLHPRKNVAFLIEAFARLLRLTRATQTLRLKRWPNWPRIPRCELKWERRDARGYWSASPPAP